VEIIVNGKPEPLKAELMLSAFLQHKKLAPDTVVVEHNQNIISREQYDSTRIKDKDRLEILRFVGGG
jgi:sulfur carrier protein